MWSPTLDVLQARGQRAVGHLDRQELQVLLVVGADDAVGARSSGLSFTFRPIMVKWPLEKRSAGSRVVVKLNRRIGPVVHRQDTLFEECAHGWTGRKMKSGEAGLCG
jgi:hypothetical protein